MPKPRLAVFLSGSGRTLLNLHEHVQRGALRADLGLAVCSSENVGAERARGLGMPTIVRRGTFDEPELLALVKMHAIDWVVLAGYLKLLPIPKELTCRVVNIHPSLLPAFGGPGMYGRHVHEAVLAAGCKVSGCTVHLCDAEYDRGPIVLQRACPVLDEDTPDTLAARVFQEECEAYPAALELLVSGRVTIHGRRTRIAP